MQTSALFNVPATWPPIRVLGSAARTRPPAIRGAGSPGTRAQRTVASPRHPAGSRPACERFRSAPARSCGGRPRPDAGVRSARTAGPHAAVRRATYQQRKHRRHVSSARQRPQISQFPPTPNAASSADCRHRIHVCPGSQSEQRHPYAGVAHDEARACPGQTVEKRSKREEDGGWA